MHKPPKDTSMRKVKLPDYLKDCDYEPAPTAKETLDSFWDGESMPPDSRKESDR